MVNGVVGLPGKAVLFHVMLALERDTEHAPIQHHLFMAIIVLVMQRNMMLVINRLAAM